MPVPNRVHRRMLATFFLAILPVLAACNDDPAEPGEELPAAMRLTVGSQIVTVDDAGNVTGGPITIPVGTTSITAVFLDADLQPADFVSATEFELRVTPASTAIVTFARASAFAGSLTGVSTGSTTIEFALFHLEEQHDDFGPFNVPLTVQ